MYNAAPGLGWAWCFSPLARFEIHQRALMILRLFYLLKRDFHSIWSRTKHTHHITLFFTPCLKYQKMLLLLEKSESISLLTVHTLIAPVVRVALLWGTVIKSSRLTAPECIHCITEQFLRYSYSTWIHLISSSTGFHIKQITDIWHIFNQRCFSFDKAHYETI